MGVKERMYQCEDCSGCPYANCKRQTKTVLFGCANLQRASGSKKSRKYPGGASKDERIPFQARRYFWYREKRPVVRNCPRRNLYCPKYFSFYQTDIFINISTNRIVCKAYFTIGIKHKKNYFYFV